MTSRTQAEFVERTQCINCGRSGFTELSHGGFSEKPLTDFIAADPSGEDIRPYFEMAQWSLVKCDECSQVFHRRILTDAWNERRFNEWMSAEAIADFERRLGDPHIRQFDAARSYVEHILRLETLTRSIRGNDRLRLLDFGCGWGKFLEICQLFGFHAVGVDRSTPRVSRANVQIFSSIEAVGMRQKMHAITLFETLEHLDEPSEVLKKLFGMLEPGGILILETPDCAGVVDIKTHHDYLRIHPLEHINAFTHETLRSIAERQGFTLVRRPSAVVTPDPIKAVKRLAKHGLDLDGRSTQLYFRKE